MRRSVIDRLPDVSAPILISGFVVYTIVCIPAIGTSDRWTDPFYRAIPWLWVVPVIVSAPFDTFSKRRRRSLFVYALATAVIMGGCFGLFDRPSDVHLRAMVAFGLIFWGPIHIVAAAVTEAFAQFVLRYIRIFAGVAGTPTTPPGVVEAPRRIRAFYIVVLTATLAFPFVYRQSDLALARWHGEHWAERDWAERTARLMIPGSEVGRQRGVWPGMYDPKTGLEIYGTFGGIAMQIELEAYRVVIEKKLAQYGPAPLAKFLFTPEELISLLSRAKFERVASFPFAYGGATVYADGAVMSPGAYCHGPTSEGERLPFVYRRVFPEKGNVMVVVTENGFQVVHPDGRLLQSVRHPITEDMIRGGS
jgi:hypothetical protein